ncbi:mechanosensitive ion channel domain-containing protein [Shewanella sp. 6_MG-2023]|uniref:mechanosensitive ion channel domain-containing protein n=1 Tax=Shewanella sp. 6_MG-2023 TaxID=3062660 RepID=UPI0026E1A116|nr:mechanosensitive ion channel domain-containing protein [Shewanella sp. 6_MG-2023]MDO6619326.1 mechanosensitive ion channel [Shewanella sp. 6_MG-2023]
MIRIAVLLFCIISFTASATSPLQLDKRLGFAKNTNTIAVVDIPTQIGNVQQSITRLRNEAQSYDDLESTSAGTINNITAKINQPAAPIIINDDVDISQQASMAYYHLSEQKQSENDLSLQLVELNKRQTALPTLIRQAKEALNQHKRARQAPLDTPLGKLQSLQAELLEQHIATLSSELSSGPKQKQIVQLQLQLLRLEHAQQERLIEQLNQKNNQYRQQKAANTIANNLIDEQQLADEASQEISAQNQLYADELIRINNAISDTIELQEKAEKQYQSHALQLANVEEQITWVETNSAFGDRFLQMLQSLPKPTNQDKLLASVADSRLKRYQAEQQKALNKQQLSNQKYLNNTQVKLLTSQQSLIEQVVQSYDVYLNEQAKLRNSYEQLTQIYLDLKNTLNEHLFWVPNAAAISGLWLIDLKNATVWMMQTQQGQLLKQAWAEQNIYWAWWVITLILCLMAQDLLTPKFNRTIEHYGQYVGNVTQDKFKYTAKTLALSLCYSLVKPLPVLLAGWILFASELNLVHAIGVGVLSVGGSYLVYRVFALLACDNGILVCHFRRPEALIRRLQEKTLRFIVLSWPLIGIIGFTEALDSSLIRNSIGRLAFFLFTISLLMLYKDLYAFINDFRANANDGKNMKLLHKVIWAFLITVPCASIVFALIGYYFSAFQVLLQLQLALLLGLGFLLLYQLLKRWMLIERRLIAFDRAKTKRAERLAQRERGELNNTPDVSENYEEPKVDLETISSQSLGLVRSLLILAFFASLLGLISQTHTALFSFLDGITLWSTHSVVNGIEQQIPITLKSILFAFITVGFSAMIAKNLPGLLELTILQRLELSPGTGFAITTVSSYVVVFLGMLIGFSTVGVEWSKLQWLVAALSVGLGFGLQEIFANFISGLIILFEKPIRIGDTVTIRDLTGTVSKIEIRATTIVDWDRKEIIVPNKAFITEQLVNWSLSDPITRVIVYVSVQRDADPSKVEALLHQAVRECDLSLTFPEPEVWFAGFGQHTQDYEVRSYAKDMNDRWPLRHNLHKRICKKLKENQVELAYPQMEIHINNGQSREFNKIIKG